MASGNCNAFLSNKFIKNRLRGQIWSFDVLTASIFLVFIILLFVTLWSNIETRWNNIYNYRTIWAGLIFASDSMLTTTGDPPSWHNIGTINSSTVRSFGLVDERNVLNQWKLNRTANMSSTEFSYFKERLMLSGMKLHIIISDMSENITLYEFGDSLVDLKESANLERLAMMDSSIVIMKFEVWK